MIINTNTKLTGLIGYPLIQSFSPVMQNEAFTQCKLDKIYIPIEVLPEDLGTVVKGISKMNFDGFNVTKPYKIDIIKYLDKLDEYAELIGAVNTVQIIDGFLKGYNTDGTGFLRSFEETTGSNVNGKNIFILGSGGAARSISFTLAINNAKRIYICNRTYEKAESLAADINRINKCSSSVPMQYEEMKRLINNSDILINTTSVGMYPHIDKTPVNINLLHKNLIVCDIVYNPKKTKLLKDAEERGCKIVPGLPMLIYQGAEAFKIWTNIEAPTNIMFKVVEEGLNNIF